MEESAIPPRESHKAWIVLGGAVLGIILSLPALLTFGLYIDQLEAHNKHFISRSEIVKMRGLAIAFATLPGPLYGAIAVTVGAHRLFAVAAFTMTLGQLAMSLVHSSSLTLTAAAYAHSVGTGGVYFSSLSLIGSWFDRRFSIAAGLGQVAISAGLIIYPTARQVGLRFFGFREALLVEAFISAIVLASIFIVLVRAAPVSAKWKSEYEEYPAHSRTSSSVEAWAEVNRQGSLNAVSPAATVESGIVKYDREATSPTTSRRDTTRVRENTDGNSHEEIEMDETSLADDGKENSSSRNAIVTSDEAEKAMEEEIPRTEVQEESTLTSDEANQGEASENEKITRKGERKLSKAEKAQRKARQKEAKATLKKIKKEQKKVKKLKEETKSTVPDTYPKATLLKSDVMNDENETPVEQREVNIDEKIAERKEAEASGASVKVAKPVTDTIKTTTANSSSASVDTLAKGALQDCTEVKRTENEDESAESGESLSKVKKTERKTAKASAKQAKKAEAIRVKEEQSLEKAAKKAQLESEKAGKRTEKLAKSESKQEERKREKENVKKERKKQVEEKRRKKQEQVERKGRRHSLSSTTTVWSAVKSAVGAIVESFGLSLFLQGNYYLVLLQSFCASASGLAFTLLPPYLAGSRPDVSTTSLLTTIGAFNMGARVAMTLLKRTGVGQRIGNSAPTGFGIVLAMCAITSMLDTRLPARFLFAAAASFGLADGLYQVLQPIMLRQLFGGERFSSSFSHWSLAVGAGSALTGEASSRVTSINGDYRSALFPPIAVYGVSLVALVVLELVEAMKERRRRRLAESMSARNGDLGARGVASRP